MGVRLVRCFVGVMAGGKVRRECLVNHSVETVGREDVAQGGVQAVGGFQIRQGGYECPINHSVETSVETLVELLGVCV